MTVHIIASFIIVTFKNEQWFPLQGERGHSWSFVVFKKLEKKGDGTTDLSIYPTL